MGRVGDLMNYDFYEFAPAGIEAGPADGESSEEDPDMASKRERRRRRAERRERVGDVWRDLGFEVEAGPFSVRKEAQPRGRGRGDRGRRPDSIPCRLQLHLHRLWLRDRDVAPVQLAARLLPFLAGHPRRRWRLLQRERL